MEEGFIKANSSNLPMVDSDMVYNYFIRSSNFSSVEMRGRKLLHSTRESYGDNAVGFVQLKRIGHLCTIYARITPEHKVRDKGYLIKAEIDEEQDSVQSCKCEDCPASEGGCKHAAAFLLWLHRRSEEPSVTAVTCYWKKPKMSLVGGSKTFITAQDMGDSKPKKAKPNTKQHDGLEHRGIHSKTWVRIPVQVDILNDFVAKAKENNCQSGLLQYMKDPEKSLSIHKLCVKLAGKLDCAESFLRSVATEMAQEQVEAAFMSTKGQSDSPLWFELRYARITGSLLYEAAQCKTIEGSLVSKIMGQKSPFLSLAMTRGKRLEKEILKVVAKNEKIQIQDAGLLLRHEYPVLGATPDGWSEEYVVEVKCPSSEKTLQSYVKNEKLEKKFWTQVQSQMFFSKKKMALFCVAQPDFETSNLVNIYHVPFDPSIISVLDRATNFWIQAIFPKLKEIYSLS